MHNIFKHKSSFKTHCQTVSYFFTNCLKMLQMPSAECTENTSVVAFTVLVYNLYPKGLWFCCLWEELTISMVLGNNIRNQMFALRQGKGIWKQSFHFQNATLAESKLKFAKEIKNYSKLSGWGKINLYLQLMLFWKFYQIKMY